MPRGSSIPEQNVGPDQRRKKKKKKTITQKSTVPDRQQDECMVCNTRRNSKNIDYVMHIALFTDLI